MRSKTFMKPKAALLPKRGHRGFQHADPIKAPPKQMIRKHRLTLAGKKLRQQIDT